MISDMAIEIDGVEYLFMADALVFAGEVVTAYENPTKSKEIG